MRAKRWRFVLLLPAWLAVAAWAADVVPPNARMQVCEFHRPTLKDASANLPKVTRVGSVVVNGINLPAYSVAIDDGSKDIGVFASYMPDKGPLHVKLNHEMVKQFVVYGSPMGTILVPRNWIPRTGGKGANSAFNITFAPDTTGQVYLSLEYTGTCAGCASLESDMYFGHTETTKGNAKMDDIGDDPALDCLRPGFVRTVSLGRFQVAYNIKADAGNPVDGIAYFNDEGDIPAFYDVQVSLPEAQHALASALLNQFVIHGKSK